MFRRRTPLSRPAQLRALVWPRLGWRRAVRYIGHRLGRMSGSPHRISAGVASGVAVSFTPLIGLHFALAALLALATRGNIVAAILGTLAGNPWTLPFFWIGSYRFGLWILPDMDVHGAIPPFVSMFTHFTRALLTLDLKLFAQSVWPVWWPMMVGSVPLAVLSWIGTYLVARSMIGSYQERIRQRRTRPRDADAAR